jgi:hypothetical protein
VRWDSGGSCALRSCAEVGRAMISVWQTESRGVERFESV